MHVHKITVKKFRLLLDCSVHFQENTTVIVGRNNSGKTSLTELFRRFLTDNIPIFNLEDFSLCAHEEFWNAYQHKIVDADEADIRMTLPEIEIDLLLSYDPSIDLGPLGDFVVDLDPECTTVKLQIRFALEDGKIDSFFENDQIDTTKSEEEQKKVFFKYLKERIPRYFKSTLSAVDPNDQTNSKQLDFSKLRALLRGDFINAQRGLDDLTHKDSDVLGRILEMLFTNAKSDSANSNDNSLARELEIALLDIQNNLDTDFNNKLEGLLPTFELFGYPGLPDPQIKTETNLDVERLLKNHTRVRYAGLNGIHLPESYNGLGSRNLIFILLKLHEFFKTFRATEAAFGAHLIFIEEPEAHLHPQMQEVFINQLDKIVEAFSNTYNNGQKWPVQFVVTTHSSHLANRAPFEAMRYFLSQPLETDSVLCVTKVKDLRDGFTSKEDKKFLHQYMTLTRCDMLFADKAILIEGTCERLLLPEIIKKIDAFLPNDRKLESQYITYMEVGGATAQSCGYEIKRERNLR